MCNPSKTEVIQFSFRFVKNPILSDFLIGNSRVQPSGRLCNLGVNLDRELNVSHNSGAPARAKRARAAEHHGEENLVNYPSEKIWL